MVDAPVVTKTDYRLINIDEDGYMTLMKGKGNIKADLRLPEDEWLKEVVERAKIIFEEDEKDCLVTVIAAMGQEKLITSREIDRK